MILPQIKKKRSLSNVGHRGTKAENLAWHATGYVQANSRSLNKNDQRSLSATFAVDVMLSLGLVSVFELPFG